MKKKSIRQEMKVIGLCWSEVCGYYKGSNLIGYRVLGGFWVDFFHKKPPIQP